MTEETRTPTETETETATANRRGLRETIAPTARAGEQWLFDRRRASYGIAVVRILFGLTALGFLAANWLNRHYLWGDAARWLEPIDDNGGFGWPFTFLSGGNSTTELNLKLGVVAILLMLLVVGWRTRVLAPIILILWVSLIESQPIYGDQSDNIFRILFLYMCFADMSGRWSVDARRRAKQAAGEWHSPIPFRFNAGMREDAARVATLLHNLAIVAIGAQICIIYLASGLYKVQGERWQDGTAIFYPLQVSQYAPWPPINELLGANALGVLIVTYFSVFIQIFFPLMLLRRTTRIIALLGVAAMHLGIALFMGLPFFSLFIMAGDMIFIRDTTYRSIADRLAAWWRQRRGRAPLWSGPPGSGVDNDHVSKIDISVNGHDVVGGTDARAPEPVSGAGGRGVSSASTSGGGAGP